MMQVGNRVRIVNDLLNGQESYLIGEEGVIKDIVMFDCRFPIIVLLDKPDYPHEFAPSELQVIS